MLKIVMVLLVAGSGDTRPQKSGKFLQKNDIMPDDNIIT